ncbi:MAG: ATP-binding protein, partial [Candidatus Binatia bacterium]
MVTEVDYLVAQGVIREVEGHWQVQNTAATLTSSVPDSLRQLIEKQFQRLTSEEQRLLEAASVAGAEFSVAAVAAGVQAAMDQVEEECGELARRGHFLRAQSGMETWPDGTVTGRYGFLHALYQNVLYERQTAGRRLRLHQRIGERMEAGYGERTGEIAAELAMHFEKGQDYQRAVQYLQQAGEKALQRSAPREASTHLTTALELLKTLPNTPARLQQELTLLTTLGPALNVTQGHGAPEVGQVYTRARELCQQLGETPQLFPVLWGLWYFSCLRVEHQTARELGEQCLALALKVQDPAFLVTAHHALGVTLFLLGEFLPARELLEQRVASYDPLPYRSLAFLYGQDPRVACLLVAALPLWYLGYPEQAVQKVYDALTLAQEFSHPYSVAFAVARSAILHQLRRDAQRTHEQAEALIALCTEQGFPLFFAWGTTLRGWALAEQGHAEQGIAQIHQGLTACRATAGEALRPYFLALLAEAYGKAGQPAAGLAVLAEAQALVNKTGERHHEVEVYRLKGQLTLQSKACPERSRRVQSPKSKVQSPQSAIRNPQLEAEAEGCFQ